MVQFLKGPFRVYCRVKPMQSTYPIALAEESKSATPTKYNEQQAILKQSTDTSLTSCIRIGPPGLKDQNGKAEPSKSLQLVYSEREVFDYFVDGVFSPEST